jgi:hypothetical protein
MYLEPGWFSHGTWGWTGTYLSENQTENVYGKLVQHGYAAAESGTTTESCKAESCAT